ncbi:MAG: hypothetical protein ACJ796_23805 [Gemmatimonadaceae bacterium]
MSQDEMRQDVRSGNDEPRLEPWLATMLLAVLPMLAALALPREFVPYLATISGVLFAAGAGLLIVQERRRR